MQNLDEGCSDGPSRASMHRGRTMAKYKLVFVAFDSAKDKHAVAVADEMDLNCIGDHVALWCILEPATCDRHVGDSGVSRISLNENSAVEERAEA